MLTMSDQAFQIEEDPASLTESSTSTLSMSTSSRRKACKVSFQGVAVREYTRILGDNPSTDSGPPLGLDWDYKEVVRECSSEDDPLLIPIDIFEQESERRRRIKLMEMCKLRQQSVKQLFARQRRDAARAATNNTFFKDDPETSSSSDDTLSDEQMKQLSAHWLKIQPLTGLQRRKILLKQTKTTKMDIEENEKAMRKIRGQRAHTAAMAETGLDDWQAVGEFFKRRWRRYKSGISKKKEQEQLWEDAKVYYTTGPGSQTSSMRSDSMSSFSSQQGEPQRAIRTEMAN